MKQHTISLSEAICYEQRSITGWRRPLWELLRSVLINCRPAFPFFYPFPFCLLFFSNKPPSSVTRFHETHSFFTSSCLLPILTNPARLSHQQVTEVHASERNSEQIVKFVPTLSKHTRQEREAGYWSGGGPHVALTSLLSLLANVQFIKVGSCVSYSMSARKDSLSCKGGFRASLPVLITTLCHSRFTIPKDKP